MNVVMNGLAAALVLVLAGADVHLVAWAYVAGAAAQLVLVSVMAGRRGFRFVPSTALADPEIRATGRLAGRPLLGAGLNPVARLCEQFVVSFLPSGSITILNYGYRLISAIGGSVFFRSVMVTLLPRLTRATARADADETERMTALGVRMMLVVSVPLTAFMAVLSKPFVRALFQRGNFSPADASLLGAVLAVYAASLVGSALQRAMLAPFYARLDTRVPLRNTFYGVAANIALLACTGVPLRHHPRTAVLGVALAYSLAQYVNLAHAWIILRRTMPRPFAGTGRLTLHLTFASAASAGAMFALAHRFGLDGHVPPVSLFWRAGAVGGVGVAVLAGILATAVTVRPAPMLRPLWPDR
jgi:peptidoglycan biosynthesis protein MviN/MurJ (putative lipid II flippase)